MKRTFKVMSSVCAAGIMAVSAVSMSGCGMLSAVTDVAQRGFATVLSAPFWGLIWLDEAADALSSEKTKQEKVLSGYYIDSTEDSLWTAVDRDKNPVTLSYYKYDIDLFYTTRAAIVQYSQPIDELLAESEFWLPLPMAEKAKELFNRKEVLTSALDGANGYWFFYTLNQLPLSKIDLNEYNFSADDYDVAWYDSDTKTLYCYRFN